MDTRDKLKDFGIGYIFGLIAVFSIFTASKEDREFVVLAYIMGVLFKIWETLTFLKNKL